MDNEFKVCQSCGKLLKADNIGYKIDNLESIYCSVCYDGEQFTQELSLEEMQALVSESIKDKHIPKFVKNRIVEGISDLQRWI